jgi:hypothetical protein
MERHSPGGEVRVAGAKTKTASRIVPIHDNVAWLCPMRTAGAGVARQFDSLYKRRPSPPQPKRNDLRTISPPKAGEVEGNGLRHSYASCGSRKRPRWARGRRVWQFRAVVHRYYRELVRPADAVKWFA